MINKWSQKRSRSVPRDTSKEKQQNFPKVDQKAPKVNQKAPQNDTKKTLKLQKTVWVVSFQYQKNGDHLEAVFSCFLPSPGGPRP